MKVVPIGHPVCPKQLFWKILLLKNIKWFQHSVLKGRNGVTLNLWKFVFDQYNISLVKGLLFPIVTIHAVKMMLYVPHKIAVCCAWTDLYVDTVNLHLWIVFMGKLYHQFTVPTKRWIMPLFNSTSCLPPSIITPLCSYVISSLIFLTRAFHRTVLTSEEV
ncbi:hypothetical protein CHS0354_040689 [Potamilus streckersoni]|uniref:Uncharacterized protein n=1 Tax=Potamilus streckersoni TaxID=2493646 RepID=A0AAE0VYS6_9BIVA|nr:hypothetical protein CHS0354_040689 [Potamilus streckersoni]